MFADSDVSASTADVEAHRLVHAALEVQAAAASLVRHLTVALSDSDVAKEVLGADPPSDF